MAGKKAVRDHRPRKAPPPPPPRRAERRAGFQRMAMGEAYHPEGDRRRDRAMSPERTAEIMQSVDRTRPSDAEIRRLVERANRNSHWDTFPPDIERPRPKAKSLPRPPGSR